MDKEGSRVDSTVILHLKGHDMTVEREKLSYVSRYFAALFSHNFKDSVEKVHVINFDIDPNTLKLFINWIHDEEVVKPPCRVKPSLAAIPSKDFIQLLDLLRLSVLYAVDQLVDDLIGVLATKWLQPKKVIYIWMLAQELCLNEIKDLCVATCLDQFEELPEKYLVQLSRENILLLIQSKCVRASYGYVDRISTKWSQYHTEPLIVSSNNNGLPAFLRCTVGYKTDKYTARKAYIYCWDGTKLSEILELKDCESSGSAKKEIIGMQAAGRGFSVYVVGGERGFGTGNFNMEIWRYCLISQRWYYQARLPVARRHMVAVFLDNKLTIVGGVGRLRLKLNSVDILDIHTGLWKKAARVPEEFTEVPLHCVMKGKLFLLKSSVYIYDPELDSWQTIKLPVNSPAFKADAFTVYGKMPLFLTKDSGDQSAKTTLFIVGSARTSTYSVKEFGNNAITDTVSIVPIHNESYQLGFASFTGINILFLAADSKTWNQACLDLRSEKIDDSYENCINPKFGCFNLIDRNILCGRAFRTG